MSWCSIPGCNYSRKSKDSKRAIFRIFRPNLGKKSVEARKHYETLTNFLLQLRDFQKGDKIKELLHKETACICESHFNDDDMIVNKAKKQLKLGAIPSRNLPRNVKEIKKRKAPLTRHLPSPPVRHSTCEQLQKSFNALGTSLTSTWSCVSRFGKLILECYPQENLICPKIRICFEENLFLSSVAFSGWEVNLEDLLLPNIRLSTLHSFLDEFSKYRLCTGVTEQTRSTSCHVEQSWFGGKLVQTFMYRSPGCKVIVSKDEEQDACCVCKRHDVKTKYGKKYRSKTELPRLAEEELISVDDGIHSDLIKIFNEESEEMNEWQRMFFGNQLANNQGAASARRYHPDVIRWAIELYAKSPAAYQQLRSTGVLTLPSSKTLQQYRNDGTANCGINPIALQEIQRHPSLFAYITVDEMKIKENLVINEGRLVGFTDFGDRRCAVNELATHICVFYIRSVCGSISAPLSWWPTKGIPSYQLVSIFWEGVALCEIHDVRVVAVVADGAATNKRFFDAIHGSKFNFTKPFTAPNPYDESRVIYICTDTSHLLKTSRNALFSSKSTGTKYLSKSGDDILWTHLQTLWNIEKSKPVGKTKLSPSHMQLNSYTKMKVSIARTTLHWNVAQALRQDVPRSEGTALYIEMLHKWFEIVTCGPSNPIACPEDERLLWLENVFVQYLLDSKNEVELFYPGEHKRIIAKPTFEGLVFSTTNLIALAKYLLANGVSKVCLRVLTQDVLEALFGNLRTCLRRNTNPDVKQVGFSSRNISQRKVIKKIKGGNTTFGTSNPWKSVCSEPLRKKKKSSD